MELGSRFRRDNPGLTMPFFIALQFDLISALKSFACCSIFLFASLQSLPAYFNYWFCDSFTHLLFQNICYFGYYALIFFFNIQFNFCLQNFCFLIYFFSFLLSYNLCLYITVIYFYISTDVLSVAKYLVIHVFTFYSIDFFSFALISA